MEIASDKYVLKVIKIGTFYIFPIANVRRKSDTYKKKCNGMHCVML